MAMQARVGTLQNEDPACGQGPVVRVSPLIGPPKRAPKPFAATNEAVKQLKHPVAGADIELKPQDRKLS